MLDFKVPSMADDEVSNGEPIACGSYSQLLFADDDVGSLDTDVVYNFTSSFSTQNPPKMLCFGDPSKMLCFGDNQSECDLGFSETTKITQKSGVTFSTDSSSASSITTNTNNNPLSKSNRKRNGSGNESVQGLISGNGAPAGSQRNCKKTKSENSTLACHGKVKRVTLGERISALQQLVSPYGKTDTASVLHEAMGYIRFLQEQVQVLCSPYLHEGGENGIRESTRKDLRSRGLCLVPVECVENTANNNNGAAFWSPAMRNKFLPKH